MSSDLQNYSSTSDNFESSLVEDILKLGTDNPVEIVKYLQKRLTSGRALFVTNIIENEIDQEDDVNQIAVNRDELIESTFMEFQSIKDFKLTFDVDFIGENARDYGGVRLEWIGLMNRAISTKYMEDLKVHLIDEYYNVGIMAGISLIQGGIVPAFFNEPQLNQIFDENVEPNNVMKEILRGLEVFSLQTIFKHFPTLRHLFQPSNHKMSPQMLKNLMKVQFSPEGSTAFSREKKIYSYFIKYIREVASGRRGDINLGSILQFCTGCSEVPVLGFHVPPTLIFTESELKYAQVSIFYLFNFFKYLWK